MLFFLHAGALRARVRAETVFLKHLLAQVGVQVDSEAIAEYKVSPDSFKRSKMSELHREMPNGIIDC